MRTLEKILNWIVPLYCLAMGTLIAATAFFSVPLHVGSQIGDWLDIRNRILSFAGGTLIVIYGWWLRDRSK